MENFFKVKLRSQVTKAVITFDVVPDVNETRSVEYKSMNPVHMPGTIYAYGHTASRLFGVNNARFVSRTPDEAAFNLARLNLLRSWTLPYFGQAGKDLIGSPPDVLSFYAFAIGPSGQTSSNNDTTNPNNITFDNDGTPSVVAPPTPAGTERRERATHLHNIPTVMHNLQITYPSDIDYIPTSAKEFVFGRGPREFRVKVAAGVPMPTILATDIQLYETHSPAEFNKFNLEKYRTGMLDNF